MNSCLQNPRGVSKIAPPNVRTKLDDDDGPHRFRPASATTRRRRRLRRRATDSGPASATTRRRRRRRRRIEQAVLFFSQAVYSQYVDCDTCCNSIVFGFWKSLNSKEKGPTTTVQASRPCVSNNLLEVSLFEEALKPSCLGKTIL